MADQRCSMIGEWRLIEYPRKYGFCDIFRINFDFNLRFLSKPVGLEHRNYTTGKLAISSITCTASNRNTQKLHTHFCIIYIVGKPGNYRYLAFKWSFAGFFSIKKRTQARDLSDFVINSGTLRFQIHTIFKDRDHQPIAKGKAFTLELSLLLKPVELMRAIACFLLLTKVFCVTDF
ncbi:hypothetical protein BDF20DRAFT_839647 [Mycotypha africana]|uniref:uncharacterized protein n=1 Tax=Mycotypha africana TaxID=64632 RepID=UPI002300C574|nr:uncharacterized protein BDF20DRAFT_839647 [Mycotypha africana]KAI8968555.1 hypothetical protein BDF20DRAFT_839647 [Mycotypha africana]